MTGVEFVIDAKGCSPAALRSLDKLRALLDRLVKDLPLHPVAGAQWHVFPGEAGVTGLCLLAESHFAVHTFPEHGSLCLNLFCCRPREDWDFASYLKSEFQADEVCVRKLARRYA
jgi:S-adenosylmethionine decarboxylase